MEKNTVTVTKVSNFFLGFTLFPFFLQKLENTKLHQKYYLISPQKNLQN